MPTNIWLIFLRWIPIGLHYEEEIAYLLIGGPVFGEASGLKVLRFDHGYRTHQFRVSTVHCLLGCAVGSCNTPVMGYMSRHWPSYFLRSSLTTTASLTRYAPIGSTLTSNFCGIRGIRLAYLNTLILAVIRLNNFSVYTTRPIKFYHTCMNCALALISNHCVKAINCKASHNNIV